MEVEHTSVINAPLDVIQKLFEQNHKHGEDWGVTAHFEELDRNGHLSEVRPRTGRP